MKGKLSFLSLKKKPWAWLDSNGCFGEKMWGLSSLASKACNRILIERGKVTYVATKRHLNENAEMEGLWILFQFSHLGGFCAMDN